MYAILHRTSADSAPRTADALRLRQIAGPLTLTVTLAAEPPADPAAFEVQEDCGLTEPDARATVAQVLTFTGPLSDAVRQAGSRASSERIAPAMRDHPGGVRLLSLWQPELRRQVVITLATSLEALEEGGRRIAELPLLPDEDVALLPGPDHVEIFRVES